MTDVALRPASPSDASFLARAIDLAGHGLPRHLWQAIAGPEGDALAIGRERAARDEGGFSWRNAVIAVVDGTPAGALVSYLTPAAPEPVPAGLDPCIAALIELENLAPRTRYINAVAVVPEARGLGVGRALMTAAGASPGPCGLSLITTDDNHAARTLYERMGYVEHARRRLLPGGWRTDSREWVLMLRR